ncbi:MAG: serine hydrolase domain-containing protein [Chloroflexota bacterium]
MLARLLCALLLVALVMDASAPAVRSQIAVSGEAVPEFTPFDEAVTSLLERWSIPGAALAVSRNGHLVLARGYGLADVSAGRQVQPDSLFRVASVSKPITAVAIMQLVEQERLSLDAPAYMLLDRLIPTDPSARDPRLAGATVRTLLQHTGGWDRGRSFDPLFMPWFKTAAEEYGDRFPTSCETVARFMLARPLDFAPGAGYAYSNFGYCLLGLIVERISGQPYQAYVREHVLMPAGISRMALGRTAPDERLSDEVTYYDIPDARLASNILGRGPALVARPYGAFALEAMAANGGWVGSAMDLVRFADALDGRAGMPLLLNETLATMTERPERIWQNTSSYYGMGWLVRPVRGGATLWHTGSLPGSYALLVRQQQGTTWAVVFNSRPADTVGFGDAVEKALAEAARSVDEWPEHDQYTRWYSTPGRR